MASSSSTPQSPPRPQIGKRLKLRKGTFSCWECKHRKIRCSFNSDFGDTCVSCQRRGLTCIRQDLEDPIDAADDELQKRLFHIESLVGQVVQQRKGQRQYGGRSVRRSRDNASPSQFSPIFSATPNALLPTTSSLGSYLRSSLPHPTTINTIISRGGLLRLPVHVLQLPRKDIISLSSESGETKQSILLPPPTAHPIQFARILLQLALCLQLLDSANTSESSNLQLGIPVKDIVRHFANIASCYVTSQDLLVNSIDGLETLMLEAMFLVHQGSLRQAWLLFRRCITLAQLIGLPDIPSSHERRMWLCFVYGDRTLSLTLGLPFTLLDDEFLSEEVLDADTPARRLERSHILLIGRIITRNLGMRRSRRRRPELLMEDEHYEETQNIDYGFKMAAAALPIDWWGYSSLDGLSTSPETMERTSDLMLQMQHHYYIVTLHLPYLVADFTTQDCAYSKMAAASASREMLSRFVILRNFYLGPAYRPLDDKAFTTLMALLLVHLDGHRLGRENVLEHQRRYDIMLIDQTISIIQNACSLFKNELSHSNLKMLWRLVEFEARVANGSSCVVSVVDEEYRPLDTEVLLHLPIPFFGTIRIMCID